MAEGIANADTPAGVLPRCARRRRGRPAEAGQLRLAVAGRRCTPPTPWPPRRTVWDRDYGDTGIPVAGPGAPLVAEFSVAEFAAALGMTTDAGRGVPG